MGELKLFARTDEELVELLTTIIEFSNKFGAVFVLGMCDKATFTMVP